MQEYVASQYQAYRSLVLYVVIGVSALVLDVSLFWVLQSLHNSVVVSNLTSMFIGMLFSFAINSYLNFKTTDKILKRFGFYTLAVAIGYGLSTLGIIVLHARSVDPKIGKLIMLPAVFCLQYFINKSLAFKAN